MKPRYNWSENNVLARCPDCDAVTSFDTKGHSNTDLGLVIINRSSTYNGTGFSRILWQPLRCSVCNRGAVAKILDQGNRQSAVLEDFIPRAVDKSALPDKVPDDIVKEFREAELGASHGAYRSASAMIRSVLEKTLKKNGYDVVEVRDDQGNLELDKQGNPRKSNRLIDRIDAAAWDKVITEKGQKRAHENIRVLGNDVLHDDWREVLEDEFEADHKYTERILEDFYGSRPAVEARVKAQNRAFVPSAI